MTIQSLIEKFRTNSLTPEELKELRHLLKSTDDLELTAIIEDASALDETRADIETLQRLKTHLNQRILTESSNGIYERKPDTRILPRIYRIVTIAASIIIPILIIALIYLTIANRGNLEAEEILLTTTHLGKTNLTLPDGTQVILRGDSKLWIPTDFGNNIRNVRLNGQARFDVTHLQDQKEFTVQTPGMDVTGHGTVFSLTSRDGSEYAEISLEKGSVSLSTGNENIKLVPGETAILNRETGKLQVSSTSLDFQPDWNADELTFNDVDPQTLIREIENAYNVKLASTIKTKIDKNFTGTLPWNDLSLTLDALRYIYGFDLPYTTDK